MKTASLWGNAFKPTQRETEIFLLRSGKQLLCSLVGVSQLMLFLHTGWNPLALRKEETHSSEEQSASSVLYTWVAYGEGGRTSLKRYTWEKKYYLWKRRDTSLSDRCGQGCRLPLTSAWVKKGLWGWVPPLSICLVDNEPAFRQAALAVRRPHLPIDALRVTSFQEEFGIKNVSVTTHILRGFHMWELEMLDRISLWLIQHT